VSRNFAFDGLTDRPAGLGAAATKPPNLREETENGAMGGVDALGIRLFSVDELALALGQDRRWVYRQTEERGLPALKLGRSLVFQLPAVLAWLEAHRVGDWGDGR
jgi:excisionase family DNA binding protein